MDEQMDEERYCQMCVGEGFTVEIRSVPTCCGNLNSVGECRSHCAVQEQEEYQEPCDYCGGSGVQSG